MKTFPTKSRLLRHINGKKLCKIADNGKDLSKQELLNEVAKASIKPPTFITCPKCSKCFSTMQNMKKHEMNCQGIACFLKTPLIYYKKYQGHSFKDLLRSIFYSTYIDTKFKWVKRNGIAEVYKIYMDNQWTKKLSVFTITNKFLEKLSTDTKLMTDKARAIGRFYCNLNIQYKTDVNFLKSDKKNKWGNGIGQKGEFYDSLYQDIKQMLKGDTDGITGLIPFEKYTENTKLMIEKYDEENERNIFEMKQKKLYDYQSKLERKNEITANKIEYEWDHEDGRYDTREQIDKIIRRTNLEDEDDIAEMYNDIEMILDRYVLVQSIEEEIAEYLVYSHGNIPWRSFLQRLSIK
jgi:hypothetical protein|tara:strand:- start:190 stop:1239 length:1050 start_codon:yes stop_codon:yes gene_type:complete